MLCPRFWGYSEVFDFMELICEETKKMESLMSAFQMTSDLKNKDCVRLCRLHWLQFFPPLCIHSLCHVTLKFLLHWK